jgi:uncharacterized protein (DUF2336 family)
MSADLNLIDELMNAAKLGALRTRTEILRHVTDLFIIKGSQLSEDEVLLFDDVIIRLTVEIEIAARVLLAMRLAPIPNAPPRTIYNLAFDDAIEVAGPVLRQSERLTDADLVKNARLKGQSHMLAISCRRKLAVPVTEILIERGDQQVLLNTAKNAGAKMSETGFSRLVSRARADETLAICVGERQDIPLQIFRQLLERASENVRMKLEVSRPDLSELIRETVASIAKRIETERFEQLAVPVADSGTSDSVDGIHDLKLRKIAQSGTIPDLAAMLGKICQMPAVFTENAMSQRRSEALLFLAKAHGISRSTVKAILEMRARHGLIPYSEIGPCLTGFEKLEAKTAQHILSFYRTHDSVSSTSHALSSKRH